MVALRTSALTSPALRFYTAKVFHARLRPHAHRFTYHVLTMLIDIDRLDEAHHASPIFSVGRFNLLGFSEKDHGARDGTPLRAHVDALMEQAGLPPPDQVVLLAFPRLLGFVFNPLSVYYCHTSGRVAVLIYEVRNTFGQIHSYVVPVAPDAAGHIPPQERDKLFFVSPFMDMPLRYRFLIDDPDQEFSIKIIERDAEGVVLTALMKGKALPAGLHALLWAALSSPLLGFKVVAAIHWQALKLWLKGHHVRPRPPAPPRASVGEPGLMTLVSPTKIRGPLA